MFLSSSFETLGADGIGKFGACHRIPSKGLSDHGHTSHTNFTRIIPILLAAVKSFSRSLSSRKLPWARIWLKLLGSWTLVTRLQHLREMTIRAASRLRCRFSELMAHVSVTASETKSVMLVKAAGVPLGFTVCYNPQALVVTSVLPNSAVEQWNLRNPNDQIARGTRIKSVNGERSIRGMNGELQKAADASAVFFEVFREPYQGLLEQMTSALKPRETLSPESVESLHCRPARGCEDDCAICLGELKSGEQVIELACGHVYHRKCIGTWLTKCCPLCMQPAQSCDASAPSDAEAEHGPMPVVHRHEETQRPERRHCISL